MDEEIDNLVKRRTWDVIKRSDIGVKYKLGQIVPTTWAFKKKRYPDFTFRKFKARFCVRGDKQKQAVSKTEDSEELNTYLPVMHWLTVCIMMVRGPTGCSKRVMVLERI